MAHKLQIKATQDWLNERFTIINMENPPRQADVSYYHGALTAIEFLGYYWKRENGKHTIYK